MRTTVNRVLYKSIQENASSLFGKLDPPPAYIIIGTKLIEPGGYGNEGLYWLIFLSKEGNTLRYITDGLVAKFNDFLMPETGDSAHWSLVFPLKTL